MALLSLSLLMAVAARRESLSPREKNALSASVASVSLAGQTPLVDRCVAQLPARGHALSGRAEETRSSRGRGGVHFGLLQGPLLERCCRVGRQWAKSAAVGTCVMSPPPWKRPSPLLVVHVRRALFQTVCPNNSDSPARAASLDGQMDCIKWSSSVGALLDHQSASRIAN